MINRLFLFIGNFLLLCFVFMLPGSFRALAQQKYTISGYVKDASSGELLIGTSVYMKENLKYGITTNQYGFYSLTIDQGSYTLMISFIGYEEQSIPITLDKDLRINIELKLKAILTQEVVIEGEKPTSNLDKTEMGKVSLDIEQIKKLPAFLGEVDILKAIQLLPGVQSAGEGSSGFYVRGGGPDQNLILLDEAVVYNASHLFGFFSVFNSDAIKTVTLTKGGMPANYGGRLSSVLDITMKEGNNKGFHAEGGLGFIASRLTVQGPIKKDTSSFIISARRTFVDLFMRKPFIKESSDVYGNSYYFYDLNTKINYRLSDKDRLYLSGYFGRDVFKYRSPTSSFEVRIPWGNATASLRWNHLFNDQLFMNTSFIFTDYNFAFEAGQQDFDLRLFSGIRDFNAKTDVTWFPTILHNVKFGVNYVYHTFTPTSASARSGEVDFDLGGINKLYAHDGAIYLNDDWDITEKLKLNAGLRYTFFQQVGPFTRYVKDEGSIGSSANSDTIVYRSGENVKTYQHVEPRLSVRYSLNSKSSVKAAYTQNYQYIHMVSMSSLALPTDTWVPSSSIVQPQFATQYAAGYFRNFRDNMFESSVEVYYKTMKNQVEYKDGAQPDQNIKDNQDNNFTFGKGWSYGVELFFKKNTGALTGWIGYTLAWTERQFENLNNGETFYAKYDRRHDISLVLGYELGKRWNLGAVFVYGTGNALTLPSQRYVFSNGQIYYEYGKRNDFRMAAYHRLDISATYLRKKTKKFESSYTFSIFNVYNRANPYFIYFDSEGSATSGTFSLQARQVSLFPILPSVTYNFKF